MNELTMSAVKKSGFGRDSLSDNDNYWASSTVVFNALGLIWKGSSCPLWVNKNEEKQTSINEARKEI